jgi:hypothetical protein
MKLANAFAAALVLVCTAGTAMAENEVGTGTFQSHIYVDMGSGAVYSPKGAMTQIAGDVYNSTNPQSPAIAGVSTTDMNGIYGDRITTTGTGILQELDFTVYNPSNSAGPITSASFQINVFDAVTAAPLAGFTTSSVPIALNPGFFTIITVSGLSVLNANINVTDLVVTQKIAARTGTATRQGVALLDPPSIGSSANTLYISNTATPAGFYTLGSPPINANAGYRINVQQPVPAATKSWGAIKASYR